KPNPALLPTDGEAASHLGQSRLFGAVGPVCPALKKYRNAGPKDGEVVSRHDIGDRLAADRDYFRVVSENTQQASKYKRLRHCRSMRHRFGVGESAFGKRQSLVDSTEHPQCEGVENLRCRPGVLAEPVSEIGMTRLVVEHESLLKVVVGAGKITEIPA